MSGPETIAGAGVLVALATFAFVGVLAIVTRPRSPRPGPSTMELGDEAPAIVDLLCDDFEPTAEAVPATLLDLSARRFLDIEQYGEGVVIRVRDSDTSGLRGFERQVLDHVRSLAVDGVVPAAAMTTGPKAASTRWWKAFRAAVIEDARAAGLCRPRWAGTSVAAVWVGAAGAFGCAWLAHSAAGESPDFRVVDALLIAAGGAGLALASIAGAVTSSDRQRETETGLAVAGRWLGVGRFLSDRGDFTTTPAAAVAVWDRYVAHAAALGLAPIAVAQLPLGAEDDRHAWSRASGQWRQVSVSYPRRRPGYGQHPALAAALGLAAGVVAFVVLRWSAPAAAGSAPWLDSVPSDAERWVRGAGCLVAVVAMVVLGWSTMKLLFAVGDLFSTVTVEGLLLRARMRETGDRVRGPLRIFQPKADQRRRRYFVAVDDGTAARLRAWRVHPRLYAVAAQGERVRVVLTPRLRYVRTIERVESAG